MRTANFFPDVSIYSRMLTVVRHRLHVLNSCVKGVTKTCCFQKLKQNTLN